MNNFLEKWKVIVFKTTLVFITEQTIFFMSYLMIVQWENEQNRFNIKDILENERNLQINFILNDWKN